MPLYMDVESKLGNILAFVGQVKLDELQFNPLKNLLSKEI